MELAVTGLTLHRDFNLQHLNEFQPLAEDLTSSRIANMK
jgi:hypothetical protein